MDKICFECGNAGNMHEHHVVPSSLGGKKTVTLCETCHGKVHGIDFSNHSELTKRGLDRARERGVKLGNPNIHLIRSGDVTPAREANVEQANAFKIKMKCIIEEIEAETGPLSCRDMATELNKRGYRSRRGSDINHVTVQRIKTFKGKT